MMAAAHKSSNDRKGRIMKKFHEVLFSGMLDRPRSIFWQENRADL
jgi:hypothetical protein